MVLIAATPRSHSTTSKKCCGARVVVVVAVAFGFNFQFLWEKGSLDDAFKWLKAEREKKRQPGKKVEEEEEGEQQGECGKNSSKLKVVQ